MSKKLCPIIVGAAQYTQPRDSTQPLDPLGLIVKTCRMAFDDSGADKLKEFIDSIYMVNINSWSYEDAPGELGNILGLKPVQKVYLPDGGDSPQMLVNRAAKAIATGKSQAVLITGGEASYSIYRAKKGEVALNWPEKKDPKYMEDELWMGTTDFENKYGIIFPSCSYALFESALRGEAGRTIEEHRIFMGKIFERFSEIASKNPYAWSQKSYTIDEITIPTPQNRKVIFPYTKRMCSNLFVDQSGALIMTSEEIAEKIKIDSDKWIYLMGGADFKNIFNISQRPKLFDSPAAREGSRIALDQAGLTLKDIDLFDIYSCFPSMVQIIMNEIGLSVEDPRDPTLTGGLPYFGGPWSNYSIHAIISAVDLIRKNPNKKIMVVANGGYNTKQSFGIYGNKPPVISWEDRDDKETQEEILMKSLPDPVIEANGQITIEAYTIYYERDGSPKRGIVLGYLSDGIRTFARIEDEPQRLEELEKQELIGKTFKVQFDNESGVNLISLNEELE
jgi:acetyl-CoA C-acetyltransferase